MYHVRIVDGVLRIQFNQDQVSKCVGVGEVVEWELTPALAREKERQRDEEEREREREWRRQQKERERERREEQRHRELMSKLRH